ncbi:hypothetical protein [Crassaminicella indica]|uniref:DRTGG domain-containing protein n=1 Tax=Crassaminicella indica TaxID=2855394 RepID=A0ABX8RF83_9CLOT|nr:hypothetical protein [Crassaminicella indica]QXM06400.1 hypothetical protein KVH43_01090 [Crassaminicella indica]
MKLSEIIDILSAEIYTKNIDFDISFDYGRASDLLSDVLRDDVLRNPTHNCIFLTGLINLQVIRTAEMMDVKGIVFVRGKKPSKEMIELASAHDIILLGTKYKLYKCCGLLYSHGLHD